MGVGPEVGAVTGTGSASSAGVVRGRFIVIEGADGVGKSTQTQMLADRLGALATREPGGTAIGEELRAIFLHADLAPRAEALLVAAARAQHIAEVVEPALARGSDVVTDRYIPSSLAYQGVGRDLGVGEVEALSRFAAAGLEPDLVVVLDVADAVFDSRRTVGSDRFEGAENAFHLRVRGAYRALAGTHPGWVIVDGSGSPDHVAELVYAVVQERLVRR